MLPKYEPTQTSLILFFVLFPFLTPLFLGEKVETSISLRLVTNWAKSLKTASYCFAPYHHFFGMTYRKKH